MEGDKSALTNKEKEGLNTFVNLGCGTCHNGQAAFSVKDKADCAKCHKK